jgi:hypothetical protein
MKWPNDYLKIGKSGGNAVAAPILVSAHSVTDSARRLQPHCARSHHKHSEGALHWLFKSLIGIRITDRLPDSAGATIGIIFGELCLFFVL